MTPEKWERIKKVLEATLDDPLWKRAESVQRLCRGDRELEAEVNKLLAADECAGSFLEVPAVETISEFCEEPLSFLADEVISDRFRIIRFLNSGGMGEVYEAWDSELQERVALKTIRAEIASVPGVIDRFKREVKQARGVSHPNVCRVYDLFSTERNSLRIWFLTMQLLEGQTLLDRIREKGAFSKKECVGLIQQMVAGLNAAHELGIAHGDFKSGNIMLVSGERGQIRAVITDFGLAFKVLVSPKGSTGPSGQGTPDYMAPERRQGGEVGLAADQYSLGVVMCEMLTGLRPRHVPGAAGKADVSLPSSSNLDARSRGVICRCLRTEPEGRFKSVEEVLWVLNGTRERRKSGWWFGAAAALTITAAAVVLIGIAVDRPRVEGAAQLTPATDLSGGPSLARDGKVVAYESDRGQTGNLDIWVQHLPLGEPLRLTSNPAEDLDPSISPDGAAVIFRSERNGGGIYISTARGDGEHLLVSGGKNPRYSPDGRQVVYWVGEEDDTQPSGKLFLLTLDGGVPVRLASNFADARLPVWSSDGKFILFVGCLRGDQTMLACSEWWATSTNGQVIQETGALSLLHKDQILPIGSIGGWYGDNVLFSGRRATATSIWELKIPEQTLRASGKPVQLTSGETRDVTPAYADDGTIAYAHLSGALHVWRISQAVNPNKAVGIKITEDPAADISPSVSLDGRWLVFSRGNGSHRDIWVKDMRSGTESVFATSSQDQLSPLIDDSGENIIFESREADVPGLFIAMRGQKPMGALFRM